MREAEHEVYQDNRTFEKRGITGAVELFATTKLKYPCIIVEPENVADLPSYKMKVLSQLLSMSKSESFDDESFETDGDLNVSICLKTVGAEGEPLLLNLGRSGPLQIRSILTLLDGIQIAAYLDEKTELKGDQILALA